MKLTLNSLITSSDKYPERAKSLELTKEVLENGEELVRRVNLLLAELEVDSSKVSSGFRPSLINQNIPNAAKKSLHMTCMAVDLVDDKDQTLAKLVASKPELLKKYNLWLEHPDNTKGWVHLDISKTRADRPIRIFRP